MAFVVPNGLKRSVSAKTRQDITRRNVLLNLIDRGDEGRFRAGEERLFMQRRTYQENLSATNVGRSADDTKIGSGSRGWGARRTMTASEIVVKLRNGDEMAYDLPRLDVMQSPLNEVENARRKIAQILGDNIESQLRTFIETLATSGGASANGNAGPVTDISLGTTGSVFIKPPAAGNYQDQGTTGTGADDLILDAIDDFVLWAKDKNLVDGQAVLGSSPATLYMVMPSYLFKYYVVNKLRDKGYSLDPLTDETLRRNSVFSNAAFAGRLGLEGLSILTPNVLPNAASSQNWTFWGGYSEAIVGGIGAMLTQLITPEENQTSDGYTLRQVVNPYYELLNGDGIRRYTIAQK